MAQKPDKTTVQVADLQERGGLQATVNSGGVYSYDEARPAYVERPDDLRSNPWMQLSSALQDFDAPLGDYIKKKQEDEMEQGIAQAGDMFKQYGTDPTTGNKLAWKEVVEKHPELAGKNPWLEKGYESARLQALGLDFKAQLQDAYTTSGLINERDVNKVGQFVDKFEQEFRKAQRLHEYSDKVILGETFSKAAYEAKTGIYNRHIQDLEQQNLARTREQYTVLISKDLSGVIDDPNINFSDPNTRDTVVMPRLLASIQRISQEASLHGLPTHEVTDMVFKALAAEASERGYKEGGEDILEIIQELDFGQGKLGDNPAVKDWLTQTEQRFTNQQKADENQKRIEEERAESDAYKRAADSIVMMASKGQNVSLDTIKATGVQPRYWNELFSKANSMKQNLEQASEVTATPGLMAEYYQFYLDVAEGRKSSKDVIAVSGRYPKAQMMELLRLSTSEDKTADASMASKMNEGVNRVWKLITKTDPENLDSLTGAAAGNPLLQMGYEAVDAYIDEYQARYQELKKKGEVSSYELSKLGREVERDLMKDNPRYGIFPEPKNDGEAPKPGAANQETTATSNATHQAQVEAQANALVEQSKTKALFRDTITSIPDWEVAYKELTTSSDPGSTRLGRAISQLNITDKAQLNMILTNQNALYQQWAYQARGESAPGVVDYLYEKMDFDVFPRAYEEFKKTATYELITRGTVSPEWQRQIMYESQRELQRLKKQNQTDQRRY